MKFSYLVALLFGLTITMAGCSSGGLDGTLWFIDGTADTLRLDTGGVSHMTVDIGPYSRPTFDGTWELLADGTIKIEITPSANNTWHFQGKVDNNSLLGESWTTGEDERSRKATTFKNAGW
ncbi:MAG: hypothetical protein KDB01_01390 [Planctomycetaceae bacterium]|nr:hypothetical protein [Planctomycetaceae bacterium]